MCFLGVRELDPAFAFSGQVEVLGQGYVAIRYSEVTVLGGFLNVAELEVVGVEVENLFLLGHDVLGVYPRYLLHLLIITGRHGEV